MPPLPPNQPVQRREADRTNLFASFRKLNPPTFKGNTTARVAESWLRQIKRLLETMKIQSEQDKVALAMIQMIDEADYWWGMVWGSRNVEEMNWAQFEELFLEKYFPEPVQQEMAQ